MIRLDTALTYVLSGRAPLSPLPEDSVSGASSGASMTTESSSGGLLVEDAQEQPLVPAVSPELTVRPGRISLSQLRGNHNGADPVSTPQIATAVQQADQPAQPERAAAPAPLGVSSGVGAFLAAIPGSGCGPPGHTPAGCGGMRKRAGFNYTSPFVNNHSTNLLLNSTVLLPLSLIFPRRLPPLVVSTFLNLAIPTGPR